MPLYEYTCTSCESDFELLVRNEGDAKCPRCGTAKLEKHFSVPAAHTGGTSDLPMCSPTPRMPCGMGGCGLPECG